MWTAGSDDLVLSDVWKVRRCILWCEVVDVRVHPALPPATVELDGHADVLQRTVVPAR